MKWCIEFIEPNNNKFQRRYFEDLTIIEMIQYLTFMNYCFTVHVYYKKNESDLWHLIFEDDLTKSGKEINKGGEK